MPYFYYVVWNVTATKEYHERYVIDILFICTFKNFYFIFEILITSLN